MEDGEIQEFCVRCGRFGHLRSTCREVTNVNNIRIDRIMCSRCGLNGHHHRVCRRELVVRDWCAKCGKYGHKDSNCRSVEDVQGNSLVDIPRCARCGRFGHLEGKCNAATTVFNEPLQRGQPGKRARAFDSDSSSDSSSSDSSSSDSSCSGGSGNGGNDSGSGGSDSGITTTTKQIPACRGYLQEYTCDLSDVE